MTVAKQSSKVSSKKDAKKEQKKEQPVEQPAEQAKEVNPEVKPNKKQAPKKDAPKKEAPKKAASAKKSAPAKGGKAKAPAKGGKAKAPAKKSVKKAPAKKSAKKAQKPKPKEEGQEGQNPKTRYFKVLIDGVEGGAQGRFSGTKPKQAANKALTSILKKREENGEAIDVQIKFCIQECTRGSKHKKYYYIGERVELEKPMIVTIGKKTDHPKEIEYKFNNKVMKDKNPPQSVGK